MKFSIFKIFMPSFTKVSKAQPKRPPAKPSVKVSTRKVRKSKKTRTSQKTFVQKKNTEIVSEALADYFSQMHRYYSSSNRPL